jgi:hypothetical protein
MKKVSKFTPRVFHAFFSLRRLSYSAKLVHNGVVYIIPRVSTVGGDWRLAGYGAGKATICYLAMQRLSR